VRGRLALADFGRLPRRSHLVVATVAILAAVAGTWPLALHLRSAVIDGARYVRPEDPTGWRPLSIAADVLTTTWVVSWDLHALWWQPTRFFEANVFHPTSHALALCEHFVATALLGVPGYVVDGPVLAHQSALLLCLALNVWAMAWLVASWSGSLAAGIAAGLLFVTSAFHQRELVHLQSLGTHYFPVMLLALDRLGATGAARWAALGAVALALQVLSGQYLGVFAIVVWALASPLTLVPVDRPGGAAALASTMRGGAMLGLATAGAVVLVLPFVVPYLRLAAADLLLDNSKSLHATFGRRPWSYVLGEGRHAPIAAAQWVLVALGATACIRGSHRARLRGLVLALVAVVGASLSGGRATSSAPSRCWSA
jgi:hypothetical protein